MKKLDLLLSTLLLTSATSVFALDNTIFKEHSSVALHHAKNAASANTAQEVIHHAGTALEHTLSASLIAKGIAKNHLNAGAEELEKALKQGSLGKFNSAASHSQTAVVHITAANEMSENNH